MKGTYNVLNKKETPQSEPIPGSNMVENNAGGFSFQLDPFKQLERFLILGTEGGTYYVGERELTLRNAGIIQKCLDLDFKATVDLIVDISDKGRAVKNDPALFALAVAASHDNSTCRKYALGNLHRVARIGTHLFHFVQYLDGMRGWGRTVREAISDWYTKKSIESLSFQLAKYQQRDGWSHRDVLRLAHVSPKDEQQSNLFRWAVGKDDYDRKELTGLVATLEDMKEATTEQQVIDLIKNSDAPIEIIPTQFRTSKDVWEAALPNLGLTAVIRNLGNMSAYGLLVEGAWDIITQVTNLFTEDNIHKSRVHPLTILAALKTYEYGCGYRGSQKWTPVAQVVDALEKAMYAAFDNAESTMKRIYYGVDISGSMYGTNLAGIPYINCGMGAAIMAMALVHSEPNYILKGFSDELVDLPITASTKLSDAMQIMEMIQMGGTDCALPVLDALRRKIPVDAFVTITDSETWAGAIHPIQALEKYKDVMGLDPKFIVVGMAGTGVSIADPKNPNMLDVVGFDTSTPAAISEFLKL
jgi:60 kDa SS-A/Ro ribonucleoprotein